MSFAWAVLVSVNGQSAMWQVRIPFCRPSHRPNRWFNPWLMVNEKDSAWSLLILVRTWFRSLSFYPCFSYKYPNGRSIQIDLSSALRPTESDRIYVSEEQYAIYCDMGTCFELCKICSVNNKDSKIQPCGHLLCQSCLIAWQVRLIRVSSRFCWWSRRLFLESEQCQTSTALSILSGRNQRLWVSSGQPIRQCTDTAAKRTESQWVHWIRWCKWSTELIVYDLLLFVVNLGFQSWCPDATIARHCSSNQQRNFLSSILILLICFC